MASAGAIEPGDLSQAFRAAMRRLASGVGIVTAKGDHGPVGLAATSVTSLTMDPPAILLCVNRESQLHPCLEPGAPIAVSILSRHQRDVSAAFGGAVPRERRFEVGRWDQSEHGLPMLAEAQANLACTIDVLVPYGTHSIVIARVHRVGVAERVDPLIFQDGGYL